jgi:hypothetical protein
MVKETNWNALLVRMIVINMFGELHEDAASLAMDKLCDELGSEKYWDLVGIHRDYLEDLHSDDFWSPYSKVTEGGLGW